MGSKLSALAAVIVLGAAHVASADQAADLAKQGIDQYKAGKYEAAVATLSKSYSLDPKPETLFAQAQAERLAGKCSEAAPHYHKVLEQIADMKVAKLVQENLSLCEKAEPEKEKPKPVEPEPVKPAEPEKPQIVTKTVVREAHTDKLAYAMVGTGTLALGGAAGLLLASSANSNAANSAHSLPEHDHYADRADLEFNLSIATAVVGAGMIGYAVFRWTRHSEAPSVAVVPSASGGAVWVTSRW